MEAETKWNVQLLNELRVSLNGRDPIRFSLRRAGSLLAYLAYYPHRAHSREILIEMLWPDVEPESGRNRLNLTLSALRSALKQPDGAPEVILSDRFTVQINAQAITTDVVRFTTALQNAAKADTETAHLVCLSAAVAEYTGDLLPDHYEDWIIPERLRLNESYQDSLRRLMRLQETQRNIGGAIQSARPDVATPLPLVYNLPQQMNRFVGREEEVTAWYTILQQPERRLLTLTGFAGLGKTRVAAALAQRSVADFPDGVWWCGQEQTRAADEMLRRLAEQLQAPLSGDRPLSEQLHQWLSGRRLLLVLDNLEQVEGVSLVVNHLLQAAPGIKILATSRRALDLRGEVLLELDPLPEAEAVALFVERAQEQQAGYALDTANEADVRALCRGLEGVPLAIELAAARSLAMTSRQMMQRLNERFRLLQSRSLELAPRQRALRSAIDWSYCLLREEERRIFAQLSVFVGGFTLEDAEAVCRGADVLEAVVELRRHSFFRSETDVETQQQRFLMLESLREYGREQLADEDEENRETDRRHAEYFLEQAREQVGKYRTAEELNAVRLLEWQSGNLAAARQWAQHTNQPALFAELSRLIGYRLLRRGFLSEATVIVQEGLAAILPVRDQHPVLAAEVLRERAGLHLDYGHTSEARRLALEALALGAEAGDEAAQARAENLLGQAAMHSNERDYDSARQHFLRALTHAERAGDPRVLGNIYNNLGIVERDDRAGSAEEQAQRLARAGDHLETSLQLRRANQDRRGLAETLNSLGVVRFYAQDWDGAWHHYAEALALLLELQNTQQVALMLANLGEVQLKRGDFIHAAPLLAVSETLLIELQSPLAPSVGQMLQQALIADRAGAERVNALRLAIKPLSLAARVELAMSVNPWTSAFL